MSVTLVSTCDVDFTIATLEYTIFIYVLVWLPSLAKAVAPIPFPALRTLLPDFCDDLEVGYDTHLQRLCFALSDFGILAHLKHFACCCEPIFVV